MGGDGFQDVTVAHLPSVLPWEGEAFEESVLPFFLGLPKNEAWYKLPDTIKEG